MRPGIIRPLALCIVRKDNQILVGDGYDKVKKEDFFRILGGGIEFFETGEEALRREFQEELATDLENVHYVTTLENLFTFDGEKGHEIVLVFEADLKDNSLYTKDGIPIIDSKDNRITYWKDISEFKDGRAILYPDGILKFI